MQVFETTLKNFWFLGMEWDESSQQFFYSIKKNVFNYSIGAVCVTGTLLFLINDAKSFQEYTEALFICSSAFMCSIIYTFFYIKLEEFSEFTKICKNSVGESK